MRHLKVFFRAYKRPEFFDMVSTFSQN